MDNKALYYELTQNMRYTEQVELMPVAELWKYREFDRRIEPKFSVEESGDIVERMKDVLRDKLLREPLVIDYFAYERRALVTEGNHRLSAAVELGMKYLPVTVQRCSRKAHPKSKPVPGIEPNEYGYVRGDLTPSLIGIPGCINAAGEVVAVSGTYAPDQDEDEVLVTIEQVQANLTDAEFWQCYATITYPYLGMSEVFDLVDYDAEGDFRLMRDLDMVTVANADIQDGMKNFWQFLEVGDMFTPDYVVYLRGLMNQPTLAPLELYEELSDDPKYKKEFVQLATALTLGMRKCYLRFFGKHFFGDALNAFYGRSVYLDYTDNGYRSYITLEVEIAELREFRHLRLDDTSLHAILLREVREHAEPIHYDNKRFEYSDVDYALIHAEVNKLLPANQAAARPPALS